MIWNGNAWPATSLNVLIWPTISDLPPTHNVAAHRVELDEAIAEWCARHDLAHIQKVADAAGIGNSRYNRISEVIAHPHLQARDRWRVIDTPAGPVPALLPPPVVDGFICADGPGACTG